MANGDNDANRPAGWSKLLIPIAGGVVLAALAYFADHRLNQYLSRQENARLITNLQIQREQAESDLRKDIFDNAISALLSEDELKASELSLSKRLLKLELLAHNFGASLSISPLFTEFDRDLEQLERAAERDVDEKYRIKALRKRLRGLAKRISSDQVSALEQHGRVVDIDIPLQTGGRRFASDPNKPDEEGGDAAVEFKWPHDEAEERLGGPEVYGDAAEYAKAVEVEMRSLGVIKLDRIERYVTVSLGELDPGRRTVRVLLEICWNKAGKTEYACNEEVDDFVRRPFTLDYFNFPKIDNTRLSDNQRFSMVLEDFDTGGPDPLLEIAATIFPAEQSSLRDRPSMLEAVKLLNSVLEQQSPKTQ